MSLEQRKAKRLKQYDYSSNGAYFITVCTKDRRQNLSKIVGTGVHDCPQIQLLNQGEIADKYIKQLSDFYDYIAVDKYIIMPDHIHMIIVVSNGQSVRPVPTSNQKIDNTNSVVAKFVGTFKRFCNKEYGENIWQPRYYDHVIRNEQDYNEIWKYIENNPSKWLLTHKTAP